MLTVFLRNSQEGDKVIRNYSILKKHAAVNTLLIHPQVDYSKEHPIGSSEGSYKVSLRWLQ